MGDRSVTFKGAEKRPKNWVEIHRISFIEGLRKICKNDQRFLERKLKWDFDRYPNPKFKWANLIHIDTTKVHNKIWNVTCSRGLAGKRAVKRQTQEKRISGGRRDSDSESSPPSRYAFYTVGASLPLVYL